MGIPPKLATIMIMSVFGLCTINVNSTPNTEVLSVLCNSQVYSKGDPFGTSLAYVLDELESKTASTKNYDFFNISPYPNAFAYGHGVCNKNITSSDCKTCLGAAKLAMISGCGSSIGARSVLSDCSIRYEQYPITD